MINYYLCAIRVITLKHNNEELRNTNGCYLVTQFSSNPTNRFILSELSFLAKVTKISWNRIIFSKKLQFIHSYKYVKQQTQQHFTLICITTLIYI